MAQEVADRTNRLSRGARLAGLAAGLALAVVGAERLYGAAESGAAGPERTDRARPSLFARMSAALGHEEAPELQVLLRAPEPALERAGPTRAAVPLEPGNGYRWFARSVARDVAIWSSPDPRNFEIGGLRLGGVVRVDPASGREGCAGGWFRVEPRGYVCMQHGLRVARSVPEPAAVLAAPDLNAARPFGYVQVVDRSAFLYGTPPTEAARGLVQAGDEKTRKRLKVRSMDGGYFLSVEGEERAHGEHFTRTLHGNYVRSDATRAIEPSRLQGELLTGERSLPLAFVVREDAPVYTRGERGWQQAGLAERYARASVVPDRSDASRVRTRRGYWLARDDVRIARKLRRPEEVPEDGHWVHVDLANQTLVAYAGDEPRFATLVASGKSPRDTPEGVFQFHYKYVTTTMRGEDESGPFEVQEVPWTMFYEKNYALHGAYWHDAFGAPRSHGCTNMAPLDARWLFHFVEPELPDGWQRAADIGSYVVLTGTAS